MSAWSDLGLPAAQSPDYGYTIDAGLRRTSAETSQARQERAYSTNKRTFTLSFKLTRARLKVAERYLQENGYSWFPMTLLSGYLEEPLVTLCVRLVKDYDVAAEGTNWVLKATVEQLVERSILVTTWLYPLEMLDSAGTVAPLPLTGSLRTTLYHEYAYAQTSAPSPFSGTLVQTVFWHYITSGTGTQHTDVEVTGTAAPNPFSGILTYVAPGVTHYIGPPSGSSVPAPRETYGYTQGASGRVESDSVATTAPAAFTGALVQEVFCSNVYVDDIKSEVDGTSAPGPFTGTLSYTP